MGSRGGIVVRDHFGANLFCLTVGNSWQSGTRKPRVASVKEGHTAQVPGYQLKANCKILNKEYLWKY